jgi:O104-antigen biosynthesis beta-1,3-galactosyltransferase
MKLSVLMSVYWKESPAFLCQCLDSLVAQTLQADEVVIVEDGPLGDALEAAIASYQVCLPIVSLSLPVNVGLGEALRYGLQVCRGEYVARMDSDDICMPSRFKMQMDFLKSNPNVDVVSGTWAEFEEDCSKPHSLRRLPATGPALLRYAKFRNPINHVTAVFRKSAVLAAGSYQSFHGFEDYHLWARMLRLGYHLYNIEEILVCVRVGNGMQGRRGGFSYFKREIAFQSYLREIGLLSATEFIGNILLRAPIRLTPECVRAQCYKLLLRKRFTSELGAVGAGRPLQISGLAEK